MAKNSVPTYANWRRYTGRMRGKVVRADVLRGGRRTRETMEFSWEGAAEAGCPAEVLSALRAQIAAEKAEEEARGEWIGDRGMNFVHPRLSAVNAVIGPWRILGENPLLPELTAGEVRYLGASPTAVSLRGRWEKFSPDAKGWSFKNTRAALLRELEDVERAILELAPRIKQEVQEALAAAKPPRVERPTTLPEGMGLPEQADCGIWWPTGHCPCESLCDELRYGTDDSSRMACGEDASWLWRRLTGGYLPEPEDFCDFCEIFRENTRLRVDSNGVCSRCFGERLATAYDIRQSGEIPTGALYFFEDDPHELYTYGEEK